MTERSIKKLGLTIMTMVLVFTTYGLAQACCIYNNSRYPLRVEWNQINIWTISPSNHQCTNGTGGKVNITLLDGLRKHYISNSRLRDIDDHGWLSVYKKENNHWKVVNKHKSGDVKDTMYLEPLD